MQDGIDRKVESIKLFDCGFCINNFGRAVKFHKNDWRIFGALSVLIRHKDFGYVLFDTGYSRQIYDCGIAGKIYCKANPTVVSTTDTLAFKLKENRILPKDISYCILSHAHPDHIGGMKDFDAVYLMTEGTYCDLQKASVYNLVFKNFIPITFKFRLVENTRVYGFFDDLFITYDLFGDRSIIGVYLPGHTRGHMGIYIPNAQVLFAGDASWDYNILYNSLDMRYMARKLQWNYSVYLDTAVRMFKFMVRYPNINVIFSHSNICEGELWAD